jgi:hypothetical protein
MKERLVSFDVALIASEKEFNHVKANCYGDNMAYDTGFEKGKLIQSGNALNYILAPTQSLLQKWLRDEFDIFVSVKRIPTGSDEWDFSYAIEYLPRDKRDVKRRCLEFMNSYTSQRWNNWEDALEEGLKEGLKFI